MSHHELLDILRTWWIEEALDVSRTAVSDWRRGKYPDRRRIELAAAVRALLDEDEENAPPEWARRLAVRLRAHSAKLEVSDEDLARAAIEEAAEWAVDQADAGRPRPRGGGGSGAAGA